MAPKAEGSTEEPLNREPHVSKLIESFLTPVSIAYDRNHGPVPDLSASKHRVRVHGRVSHPLDLSIADLQLMPQHRVVCTLQCAGNRRHTMRTSIKEVQGIDWGDAAVMNCEWKGPLLRDVLLKAGVYDEEEDSLHVAFITRAQKTQNDDYYGASIRLSKALDLSSEAVLALEMNGVPLAPKHGAPVRAIVPGVAGARCVKWLEEICIQDHESDCFYQQRDYKILPPDAVDSESAEKHWDDTPSLQEMPLNSVIGFPESNDRIKRHEDGSIEILGYALPSGDGGPIKKVQVSGDDGKTWSDAELLWGDGTTESKWCWCLWTAKLHVNKGTDKKVLSRAMDARGVWQERGSQWNLRGMAYCGYGEVSGLEIV